MNERDAFDASRSFIPHENATYRAAGRWADAHIPRIHEISVDTVHSREFVKVN
jgi:hypothetical protein